MMRMPRKQAIYLWVGAILLAGCAGKTHLDKVATSIAKYGSMTVSAPILLDVEQADTFSFDLDKSATFYFNAPRVEGAVRLFTQRSVDVQVATKIQLEELAKAIATLNAAPTPAAADAAKNQITKIATTLGALNQFAPGGTGVAGIMADPALQAGMSFLLDSLEKQEGVEEVATEEEGAPPETVEEATGGEDGEFFSVLPFTSRPAQNVLTSDKFSEPLDRYSGQVSISPRQALNLAANDKMTQDLLKFLAKPEGFGNNKKAYFCIMTVACQPGYDTRTGYAGDVLVSMEYGRSIVSDDLQELFHELSGLTILAEGMGKSGQDKEGLKRLMDRYKTWLKELPKSISGLDGVELRQEASYDIFLAEQSVLIQEFERESSESRVQEIAKLGLAPKQEQQFSDFESMARQAYERTMFEELRSDDSIPDPRKLEEAEIRVRSNLYAAFGESVAALLKSLRGMLASPTGGGLVARQTWEQRNVSSHSSNVASMYESDRNTESPDSSAVKTFLYEDSFSRPLVTGVYPMVDGQVLDLRSSLREQMAMASALALSGFGVESESFLDKVEKIEQDAQTQTVFSVGSSYSANGYNFGFRVEPRFAALDNPASSRARPGYRLESIQFPAMVLIFADKQALAPEIGGDGGEYDHIVFHTEQRWTPIVDYGSDNPFSVRGNLDKNVKSLFMNPYKTERAMLERAKNLDDVKVALGNPESEQAKKYKDFMIKNDTEGRQNSNTNTNTNTNTNSKDKMVFGELVHSTLYRRRAALAATGLGSSIFVKLPSYPSPKRNEFEVATKEATFYGWKNAVSVFPIQGKGFTEKNVLGAVVGGRDASIRILGTGAAAIVVDKWGTDTQTQTPDGIVKVQLITSKGVEDIGNAAFGSEFNTEKPLVAPRVNLERDLSGRVTGITTQGKWSDATTLLNALDDLLKADKGDGASGLNMTISGGKLDISSAPNSSVPIAE